MKGAEISKLIPGRYWRRIGNIAVTAEATTHRQARIGDQLMSATRKWKRALPQGYHAKSGVQVSPASLTCLQPGRQIVGPGTDRSGAKAHNDVPGLGLFFDQLEQIVF